MADEEKSEDQIKKEMIDLLMEKITGGYSEKVVDYGTHPQNYGNMEKPDGYAKIKGPCGDTMEMFLKIQNDRIVDIAYTTDGCMTSHAAGTAATVMAKGKTGAGIPEDQPEQHPGAFGRHARRFATLRPAGRQYIA